MVLLLLKLPRARTTGMHTILAESLSFNSDVGKVCPVRVNMPQKQGCAVSCVLL